MIILFLFQHHAEGVAAPRVGVKIQVVAEDLRQPHRDFRGLARILHGVEKRAIHLPADHGDLRVRGNRLNLRGKTLGLRHDVQHPLGVNLVINLPQFALNRAAHGNRVSRAQLAQVVGALRGGRCVVHLRGGQAKSLQSAGKILSRGHFPGAGQNHLGANAFALHASQFHLLLKLIFDFTPLVNRVAVHGQAGNHNCSHHEPETSAHASPRTPSRNLFSTQISRHLCRGPEYRTHPFCPKQWRRSTECGEGATYAQRAARKNRRSLSRSK